MILNQTIEILRAATRTNRGGAVVPDWSVPPASVTTLSGCSVQPTTADEQDVVEMNSRTTRLRVFTPPGVQVDISGLDRVVHAGDTFDIDGEVTGFPDPFSGNAMHHAEFVIRRSEGG